MPDRYQPLRVLIGCPTDVNSVVGALIDRLRSPAVQQRFKNLGYALEVRFWLDRETYPGGYSPHGGQDTINMTVLAEADVLVVVFDKDLGSPWADQRTGVPYASGTVAEVEVAIAVGKTVRLFPSADPAVADPAGEPTLALDLTPPAKWAGPPGRDPRLQDQLRRWCGDDGSDDLSGFLPTTWSGSEDLFERVEAALTADIERSAIGRPRLEDFLEACRASVAQASASIAKYDQDVFVAREATDRHFRDFLDTDHVALAITGVAGTGKSNELSHLARTRAQSAPAWLLRADSITYGVQTFWQLFLDQLRQSRLPEASLVRLRACDATELPRLLGAWMDFWGTELVVYLDGVNEHTHVDWLRSDLENALARIGDNRVRVVLSCRNVDWPGFCHGTADLRRYLYAPPDTPDSAFSVVMSRFTPDEFTEAWAKYQRKHRFVGDGSPQLRDLCHDPLMLKFTALAHPAKPLPEGANREDIFRAYLEEVCPGNRRYVRDAVLDLALAVYEHGLSHTDAAEIPRSRARRVVTGADHLEAVLSLGIVEQNDREMVTFKYDAFYEYVLSEALAQDWGWDADHSSALDDLRDFVAAAASSRFLEGTLLHLVRRLLTSGDAAGEVAALSLLGDVASGDDPARRRELEDDDPERQRWKKFYCALAATLTDDVTSRFASRVRPVLLSLAREGSTGVRYAAGTALGVLVAGGYLSRDDDGDAVELLERDRHWTCRETAAVALQQMHADFEAVQARLETLADDINWRVRRQAGNTLSELCRLEPERAGDLLRRWARDESGWRLRRAVAQARAGLTADPAYAMSVLRRFVTAELEDLRWRSVNVLANLVRARPEFLESALEIFTTMARSDESVWVRRHVAFFLPDLYRLSVARGLAGRATVLVDACLADPDPDQHVVWAAVRALGAFSTTDRAAADAWLAQVRAERRFSPALQYSAVYSQLALAFAADPPTAGNETGWGRSPTQTEPPTLQAKALETYPDQPLRPRVEALARSIRSSKAETFLHQDLGKSDRYSNIQRAIEEALSGDLDRRFYDLLCQDEDEGLRWGAAQALAKHDLTPDDLDTYVTLFAGDYQYWVRRECFGAVDSLVSRPTDPVQPSETVIDLTLGAIADDEAEVRFAALGCLMSLRRRMQDDGWAPYRRDDTEEAIRRSSQDSDRQVRELATT